jgi:hypothetical protein
MRRELKLKLDEDGFPLAPSQDEWDAMTPEERAWVVAALPDKVPTAKLFSAEGDDLLRLLEKLVARRVKELLEGSPEKVSRWRKSTGWRAYPGIVARRRLASTRGSRAARLRSGD